MQALAYGKSTQRFTQWVTTPSLTRRVYLHSFSSCRLVASQICEIPRNSPKIRTYNSSRSSKSSIFVPIERAYATSISHCNFGRISYTVFKIFTHFAGK